MVVFCFTIYFHTFAPITNVDLLVSHPFIRSSIERHGLNCLFFSISHCEVMLDQQVYGFASNLVCTLPLIFTFCNFMCSTKTHKKVKKWKVQKVDRVLSVLAHAYHRLLFLCRTERLKNSQIHVMMVDVQRWLIELKNRRPPFSQGRRRAEANFPLEKNGGLPPMFRRPLMIEYETFSTLDHFSLVEGLMMFRNQSDWWTRYHPCSMQSCEDHRRILGMGRKRRRKRKRQRRQRRRSKRRRQRRRQRRR